MGTNNNLDMLYFSLSLQTNKLLSLLIGWYDLMLKLLLGLWTVDNIWYNAEQSSGWNNIYHHMFVRYEHTSN